MRSSWTFFYSPGRTLLLSILSTIIIGTFLLSLPCAQKGAHSLLDIFFTATSATCVTGLLTIPLDSFTFIGQLIILILIQIGGLGLITLTVFLMSLFIELGLGTQYMAGQVLELDSWKNSRKMITFIIGLTISVELIGTVLIFFTLPSERSLGNTLFLSVLHSVSSFCSAGFYLFRNGFNPLKTDVTFLFITTILMLVGELGFIVWREITERVQSLLYHKRPHHFSLHTKIVLSMTTSLIMFTFLILWFLEHKRSFNDASFLTTFFNILFNAVSYRSTGFTTLAISTVHLATFFIIMVISFIGSSPGSTGSGINNNFCNFYCCNSLSYFRKNVC